MDIQAEKIELIKRLADVDSEAIIERLKAILMPSRKKAGSKSATDAHETGMQQEIERGRAAIAAGKGVKIPIEDLWK